MSELQTACDAGRRTAQYGPGCTCPYASGPWREAWWRGYHAGLGIKQGSINPTDPVEVAVGTLQSVKYYDPDRGEK